MTKFVIFSEIEKNGAIVFLGDRGTCSANLKWIARFCSTLSWRRNRTSVASEVRPGFSTLSWYVNHDSSLATVSRRRQFFLTFAVLWLGVTLAFSILEQGDGKRTLFVVCRKVLSPHPGFSAFTSSQSAAKCSKIKTLRCAWRQSTYVFWHVITDYKTSLILPETFKFFKMENNSLELTRIFKENIMSDCEREKKV